VKREKREKEREKEREKPRNSAGRTDILNKTTNFRNGEAYFRFLFIGMSMDIYS
jgi:hypothetical protein